MMQNTILLLYGYGDEEFLEENLKKWQKFAAQKDNYKVVLSTIFENREKIEKILKKYKDLTFHTVFSEKVVNIGFEEINKEISLVKEALNSIKDDDIVIKLDFKTTINFNKLHKIVNLLPKNVLESQYIVPNVYTRSDKLYHPSHLMICGIGRIIKTIYSLPLVNFTDCDTECIINKLALRADKSTIFKDILPSVMLFKTYLKNTNQIILETENCSYNSIKQNIKLVNTIDIDLRHQDFHKGRFILLPHYYNSFKYHDSKKIELANHYYKSDFEGKVDLKEQILKFLSKIYNKFNNPVTLAKTKLKPDKDFLKSIEFDKIQIKQIFEKYKDKKICLYGAGLFAEKIIKGINISKYPIQGILDGNYQKHGKKLGKYKIYYYENLTELKPDIVIITVLNSNEIINNLKNFRENNGLAFEIVEI